MNPKPFKVLVCGGRAYTDRAQIFTTLNILAKVCETMSRPLIVIHGCAGKWNEDLKYAEYGADLLAEEWAQKHNTPSEQYPADWDKHNRAAGPIRNQQMLSLIHI